MANSSIVPGYEGFALDGGKIGVCIFHGGMTSPHAVRELAERVAARGFTVSAPLLAGHGTCVDDLNRVEWDDIFRSGLAGLEELDRRGCDRRILIGHSLGASLALNIAAASDNIHGLVSISAPVYLPCKESLLLRIFSPLVPFIPRDFSEVSDYEQHRPFYDRYDRMPLRFFNRLVQEGSRQRDSLRDIRCPILVIHGKKDTVVPFGNAEVILRRVRSERKEKLSLDDEGHGPLWYDAKEQTIQRILEFIQSLG